MSSVWDDSDTDSSGEDDGPTLRQRRDKWRRLAESIRAEADDQWQRECGVPAGPRRRKQRAREVPGTMARERVPRVEALPVVEDVRPVGRVLRRLVDPHLVGGG